MVEQVDPFGSKLFSPWLSDFGGWEGSTGVTGPWELEFAGGLGGRGAEGWGLECMVVVVGRVGR